MLLQPYHLPAFHKPHLILSALLAGVILASIPAWFIGAWALGAPNFKQLMTALLLQAMFCMVLLPWLMTKLKVRNPVIATCVFALASLASAYAMWAGWVYSAFTPAIWSFDPQEIYQLTIQHHQDILNSPLDPADPAFDPAQAAGSIRWMHQLMLIQQAMHLIAGSALAWYWIDRSRPVCPQCSSHMSLPSGRQRYEIPADPHAYESLIHDLNHGQIKSTLALEILVADDHDHLVLECYQCPSCQDHCVMTLWHVKVTYKHGKQQTKWRRRVNQRVAPGAMMQAASADHSAKRIAIGLEG